jgi:hypothetical protein
MFHLSMRSMSRATQPAADVAIMKTKDGLLLDIVIGVAGALIGGSC